MVFIYYLFMCFIFGTTFLAIKIGVDSGLPPFLSAGFRFFIAGVLIFVFMVWKRKAAFSLLFKKEMLFTGICLTFGTFATLYWAEQYVSSGVAAVLSSTGPMMILIIQRIIFKQKGNPLSFIGCFVGMLGVLCLVSPSLAIDMSTFWLYGCIAIMLGEVFYATGSIYSKRVINKFQAMSPIALSAVQMIHGGFLLMLLSVMTERGQYDFTLNYASLGSLVYLIVFGSMIGHSVYYWLVAKTNPIFPSTWLFISPVIALSLGAVFYGEPVSWWTFAGTFAIIAGTILVNYSSIRGLLNKTHFFTRELKSRRSARGSKVS